MQTCISVYVEFAVFAVSIAGALNDLIWAGITMQRSEFNSVNICVLYPVDDFFKVYM